MFEIFWVWNEDTVSCTTIFRHMWQNILCCVHFRCSLFEITRFFHLFSHSGLWVKQIKYFIFCFSVIVAKNANKQEYHVLFLLEIHTTHLDNNYVPGVFLTSCEINTTNNQIKIIYCKLQFFIFYCFWQLHITDITIRTCFLHLFQQNTVVWMSVYNANQQKSKNVVGSMVGNSVNNGFEKK